MISVVVPVYNAERYLRKCVKSILNQSYKDFEIVLINDGSTDRSLEICKGFERLDSRVKVVDQENQGSQKARETGVRIAAGEYLTFIDADDYINKDTLNKMWENVNEYNTDMVICSANRVGKIYRRKCKSGGGVYR